MMILLCDVIDSLVCMLLSATSFDISSLSCDDLIGRVISNSVLDVSALSAFVVKDELCND